MHPQTTIQPQLIPEKFKITTGQYQFVENNFEQLNSAPAREAEAGSNRGETALLQSTRRSFPMTPPALGSVNSTEPQQEAVLASTRQQTQPLDNGNLGVGKQMSDANVCVSEEEFSVNVVDSGESLAKTANLSSKLANSGDLGMLKADGQLTMAQRHAEALASTKAVMATPMSQADEDTRSLKKMETIRLQERELQAASELFHNQSPNRYQKDGLQDGDSPTGRVLAGSTAQIPYVSLIQTSSPRGLQTADKAKVARKIVNERPQPQPVPDPAPVIILQAQEPIAATKRASIQENPNSQVLSDFLTSHKQSFYKVDANDYRPGTKKGP